MIRSTLFYRSKTRANVRAMRRTLSRAYTRRKPARAGTIVSNNLINVAGMEYPTTDATGEIGAKMAVVNIGRPAAAIYAPSYEQRAGAVVSETGAAAAVTRTGSARAYDEQSEPWEIVGMGDATINAIAASLVDTSSIGWTHTGNAGVKSDGNTLEAEIVSGGVENKHLYEMAQATVKGRAAGAGTGEPDDLTANEVAAILATATSVGFFGETPSTQPAALTAPDSGTVNSGDATTDGVINNLRTRLGEIESRLQTLGLLA